MGHVRGAFASKYSYVVRSTLQYLQHMSKIVFICMLYCSMFKMFIHADSQGLLHIILLERA